MLAISSSQKRGTTRKLGVNCTISYLVALKDFKQNLIKILHEITHKLKKKFATVHN